jgi:hypothetical protein
MRTGRKKALLTLFVTEATSLVTGENKALLCMASVLIHTSEFCNVHLTECHSECQNVTWMRERSGPVKGNACVL